MSRSATILGAVISLYAKGIVKAGNCTGSAHGNCTGGELYRQRARELYRQRSVQAARTGIVLAGNCTGSV